MCRRLREIRPLLPSASRTGVRVGAWGFMLRGPPACNVEERKARGITDHGGNRLVAVRLSRPRLLTLAKLQGGDIHPFASDRDDCATFALHVTCVGSGPMMYRPVKQIGLPWATSVPRGAEIVYAERLSRRSDTADLAGDSHGRGGKQPFLPALGPEGRSTNAFPTRLRRIVFWLKCWCPGRDSNSRPAV